MPEGYERLTGAPEILALLYGAVTLYGVPHDPLTLIGESAGATQQAARDSLLGTHTWHVGRVTCNVTVESVLTTSQPVGAMFDYLLTDTGEMPLDRRNAFRGEIGILASA